MASVKGFVMARLFLPMAYECSEKQALGVLLVVLLACSLVQVGQAQTDISGPKAAQSHTEHNRAKLMRKLDAEEKRVEQAFRNARKALLRVNFNIWIVSKKEDLETLARNSIARETIPDSYAKQLANSKISLVSHLLPQVQRKTTWTERKNFSLFVIGIEREVPQAHRAPETRSMPAVRKGTMIVGHTLRKKFNLQKGQQIQFRGEKFTVAQFHRQRGNRDDVTIFMNLREAQDLYGMKDKKGNYQINAILAIACNCSNVDAMSAHRKAILKVLPDVQVQTKLDAGVTRTIAKMERLKQQLERIQGKRSQLQADLNRKKLD